MEIQKQNKKQSFIPFALNVTGDISMCPRQVRDLVDQYGTLLVQYDKSCYELLSAVESWTDGESLCNDGGGHLVSINNINEQEYIQAFLTRHSQSDPVWIGLNDYEDEGHLEWTTGNLPRLTQWVLSD